MYYIGPEGPKDAQLAIVAEKFGKDELANLITTGVGRPLIGASGHAVNQHLIHSGSHRSQVYLTNAVKHSADGDSIQRVKTPTKADVEREQLELYRELSALPKLNCIIAMGNTALAALSNFHYSDITRRRGSVLRSFIGTKMMPTFHPSFYMRGEWRFKPVVDFDIKRALEQAKFPEIRRPERTYYIEPTLLDVYNWSEKIRAAKNISFDIELKRGFITCIAFSIDPSEAYCIPFRRQNRVPYWSIDHEMLVWRSLQDIFLNPNACYISQNGLFDCWHLWRHGIETPYMRNGFDTMYGHQLLAPQLPHKLEFITSIYTNEPFYKDESGDWRSEIPVPDDQFWLYNNKDACTTLEAALAMQEDMREFDLLDYYRNWMQPQWDVCAEMRRFGMKIDRTKTTEVNAFLRSEIDIVKKRLLERLGWEPNVKSPIDMERMLGELQITPIRTPTGRPSTNKQSMYTYIRKADKSAGEILLDCLEVTERRTMLSNFVNMIVDSNDFYHPSITFSHTISGRSSSQGADPLNWRSKAKGGPQIQNIPRKARELFVPDTPDHELIQIDQSQAEARVVAWDADDPQLLAAFTQGKDVHRVLACILYRGWVSQTELPPDEMLASIRKRCDKCDEDCSHSERFRGKAAGHGFRYMMGINRFLVEQAKKGIFIDYNEAEKMREAATPPAIRKWWERKPIEYKRNNDWLTNPLGRKIQFYGIPDNNDLLSWYAQSTVGDVNTRAKIYLHDNLPPGARVWTETHDSVVLCSLKSLREEVLTIVRKAYDVHMFIHGRELVIPVDIAIGPNWKDVKELR